MSEPSTPARPRQLTMAGGFVIGGSVFLLLTVFETITSLQSVEMRDEVGKVLTSPTGRGLGLSVGDALSLMRAGLMVAAVCAAATAVLGIYALQRQRAARVALSILAVPILLTAPLTGGLLGALVVAAIVMLWSGPARDWFAGRPVREPVARPVREPAGHTARDQQPPAPHQQESPPAAVSTTGTSSAPPATTGFGTVAVQRPVQSPGEPQAPWGPSGPPAQPRSSGPVPVTVRVACILTWVFSGVVALLYAGMLVALAVAQDDIVKYFTDTPEWQRANIARDMLVPLLWVGCLTFLAWALGACVLAWLTWRRHNWARWLLVVSSGAAVVAALFAFPFGTLHQIAAALTVAGLVGGQARTWFTANAWSPGPRSGPPPGPPPGPDQGQPPVW